MTVTRSIAIAAAVGLAGTAAAAQDTGRVLSFSAGAGVASVPDYFGSAESSVVPDFSFSLERLVIPGVVDIGGGPEGGLTPRLSFRSVDERSAADNPELAGLADVDTTYELGAGLAYVGSNYEVFAAVRRGFGGHEGVVGEVGADVSGQVTPELSVSAGPRVLFGDDTFADTYFSDRAGALGRGAFAAGSGMISAGVEVGFEYDFGGAWSVEGEVGYSRYQGDAADSPVVLQGSDDALSAGVRIVRDVTFGF
ncbi:MAG: MipA/OmpV family protein [Paracoccaceae bacterium]